MNGIEAQPHIALVGAGAWGKNIARDLAGLGVLAGICDKNAAARDLAERFTVDAMSTERIEQDNRITGVAIATPPESHHELTMKMLAAGKHVYVEKPLAMSLAQAEAIAAASEAASRQVMVGHLIRYHPAFRAMLDEIKAGRIGRIMHIRADRMAPGRIRAGESALYDLCPHDLALIYALTGGDEPQSIDCDTLAHFDGQTSDIVTARIVFRGGISANISASRMNPVKIQTLTVVGDEGSFVFDDTRPTTEKLIFYPMLMGRRGAETRLAPGDGEPITLTEGFPLEEEMKAFVTMIADNTAPLTDMREALYVQRLLTALEASAAHKKTRTGDWIP